MLPDPRRAFAFEVTMLLQHPRLVGAPKPPQHFHHVQDEYLRVLDGPLILEVEGIEHVLSPEDGEFTIRRDVNHCTYPCPPTRDGSSPTTARFLLSAEQSPEAFKLDLAFFENWYAYQEQLVMGGARLDFIQVFSVSLHPGAACLHDCYQA